MEVIKFEPKNTTPLGKNKKRKFGNVFLIENVTGEKFVLKTAGVKDISERALKQLINECTFTFNHPGLPKIASVDHTEETISLLLEHKNGVSLDEFWKTVKKKNRLDFTKQFVAKTVRLLDEIHSKQIYHCDIKPSNILIDGVEENFEVHLIDFGLALDKSKLSDRKLIFPLGFAAPELILNRTDLIHNTTDYFALGICIYQLWTGELPLAHPNPSVFTNLQLAYPIPEHDSIPRKLNKWLGKVYVKPKWRTAPNLMPEEEATHTLIKSFEERYATSTEFLEALLSVEKRKWLF